MEASAFYVTLPANARMDIYPDYTAANYRIHMPKPLCLKNEYEVALVEIQYSDTWMTFTKEDRLRKVDVQDRDVMIKTYEPQYLPVGTNEFNILDINIKNGDREAVSFGAGKVICKLHFRPKWKPQPFT